MVVVLKPNVTAVVIRRTDELIIRSQTDTADRDAKSINRTRLYPKPSAPKNIISPGRPSHSFRAVSAVFARKSGQLFCNPLRLL